MEIVAAAVAVSVVAFWLMGNWIAAALFAGTGLFIFSGAWPYQIVALILAIAPIAVRRIIGKRTAEPTGWGVELRAFRKRN